MHHQNSLTHFSSPPNGHAHQQQQQQQQQSHLLAQGSPAGQIISTHWQQQLLKCDMVRQSRSPHHRARANAMAARTVPKSAIPITNPNAKATSSTPSSDKTNGAAKDGDSSSTSDTANSPSNNSSTNHPSSTVAPVAEAPRLTTIKPPESTWNSLDMGGVNIKNLPPTSGLFTFTFLINLYLNHNSLQSVPPEISKLRHLELLDLSGNGLHSLPPELGMLTQLKELYVFDNQLTTIPYQLGTLHQLQTLGIEGNPMESHIKNIVQKDGTPALISYLRDNCPAPPPPPARVWRNLLTGPEREAIENDPTVETVSVLSYNILCEKYATERLYGYTPSWALAWSYRKHQIMKEITEHGTDIICLQEVDIAQYEDFFSRDLEEHGYAGAYHPKSRSRTIHNESDRRLVDGCAIFYKSSRFQLVEKQHIEFSALAMQRQDFKKTDDMFNRVLGKDHIAVLCLLEDKVTGTRILIANVHVHWDPAYSDVKLVQVALLVDEVEKSANQLAKYPPRPPKSATPGAGDSEPGKPERNPPHYTDGTKVPLIIAGDFNSTPDSSVYEFLSTGSLPPNHADFLSHKYGRYTSDGMKHRLNLRSAYASPSLAAEQHLTNYTPSFQGELDYIWYSASNLAVNQILSPMDHRYLEKVVGFPNVHFPSDHISIGCELRIKPPRDHSARPPPPTNSSPSPTS
ncbi:glucose-repressible alcohol dehydrogenase transcriptional effector [Coprinopsis cinerea okayama7|uniref:CCR4-Not complex 3'-5'-exoribonuclease subunit Ccr4 n=1 Tax=Coprinopsis cinerea (strain Okayama-7 / 130 / ATCC MYA-4618 / FGSC 9003) TaxID=240176 RepID=D6RLR7_COPC7|nr:glucose-repressible alcohol dehydrogenase transcriptional effector [Coprinopsis cinerea okayama7\|eukprot:XP_002911744.1 glucose-repressible alcohol dehydrogenase transcriptional effector [Coprinopsis cinerea okayama7\